MNAPAMPLAAPAGDRAASGLLGLAERGLLPDFLVRLGIRRLCRRRLREEGSGTPDERLQRFARMVEALGQSPVAMHPEAANAQHYELPAAFFELCLGPRLKYSSCYYPVGNETLGEAEEAMFSLYEARAELSDGQDVIDLGCGWGSFTLWMAERYPRSRITAVSNSRSQGAYIHSRCVKRGLCNVRIVTGDVNSLALSAERFDRCVSVEMFEHVRNYQVLLARIACWLRPEGKLFVHLFAHQTLMYPFETAGEDNWLGRHFFTGGLMPATETLLWFQRDLILEERWTLSGKHYERTANAWLARQDRHRDRILQLLEQTYGPGLAALWFQRWRMFWMACAELFGYEEGRQWLVAHYRFVRP